MTPVKRKLTNKSLAEKCKALKDPENGLSKKNAAAKYGVPRNTVSTSIKSKHELTALWEKMAWTPHEKNTRCGNYEKVDKAIYDWSVEKRSQKTPLDGIIIKE